MIEFTLKELINLESIVKEKIVQEEKILKMINKPTDTTIEIYKNILDKITKCIDI